MIAFKEHINEKSILNLILTNRPFLMGIAMIIIIVYHLFCWVHNPIGQFNIGYVGVDIFLFLSGLGLSYSYENNSITQFYKNRIKRIYPIYLISVVATYLIYNLDWTLFDLLANISAIGLYTKGGVCRYDWYLESLFTLYILFPLFYYYGKIRMGGMVFLIIVVSFIFFKYDIPWWYECFGARLPIFLYGVIFKECVKSYKIVSIIGILLYFPCRKMVSPFLASSGLTIIIIYLSLILMNLSPAIIKDKLSYIGKHTLELYVANLFVYWLFMDTHLSLTRRFILYFIVQLITSIILIKLNRIITCSKISRKGN